MKITLNNGKVLEAESVEESFSPRMETRGVVLHIGLRTDSSVKELAGIFTPEAISSITVGEGESAGVLEGYGEVDAIRKLYNAGQGTNTYVDLLKAE